MRLSAPATLTTPRKEMLSAAGFPILAAISSAYYHRYYHD